MNTIIDRHCNSILLHVTVPPPPRRKLQASSSVDPRECQPTLNELPASSGRCVCNQHVLSLTAVTDVEGGEASAHKGDQGVATPTASADGKEGSPQREVELQQLGAEKEDGGEREEERERPLRRSE